MLKIRCDICKEELKELGALLFSPPNKEGYTRKYHICVKCYKKYVLKIIQTDKRESSQ
jgi:uncharacterized protein with PIN domain